MEAGAGRDIPRRDAHETLSRLVANRPQYRRPRGKPSIARIFTGTANLSSRRGPRGRCDPMTGPGMGRDALVVRGRFQKSFEVEPVAQTVSDDDSIRTTTGVERECVGRTPHIFERLRGVDASPIAFLRPRHEEVHSTSSNAKAGQEAGRRPSCSSGIFHIAKIRIAPRIHGSLFSMAFLTS
jgi:hypothetical protein